MAKSNQTRKRIGTLVTPTQYDELRQRSKRMNTSISNMLRRALMLPDEQHGERFDLEKKVENNS